MVIHVCGYHTSTHDKYFSEEEKALSPEGSCDSRTRMGSNWFFLCFIILSCCLGTYLGVSKTHMDDIVPHTNVLPNALQKNGIGQHEFVGVSIMIYSKEISIFDKKDSFLIYKTRPQFFFNHYVDKKCPLLSIT